MTKVQNILNEIDDLNEAELEMVLKEIKRKIDRARRADLALKKFIGQGNTVWDVDAQDYIDRLREEESRI